MRAGRLFLHRIVSCDASLVERLAGTGFTNMKVALGQYVEIEQFARESIALEQRLNTALCTAFGLHNDEIALIEQETKYQFGEW